MDEELAQLLRDYVATANNPSYKQDWNVINSKFPEFKNYDPQLLRDYVATANNRKYGGDWNVINSKFPEFSTLKKKEATIPSVPSSQPSSIGGQTGQGTPGIASGGSFLPSTLEGVFPNQVVPDNQLPEGYKLGQSPSTTPSSTDVPIADIELLLSASSNQYMSAKMREAQDAVDLTPHDFSQTPKYIGPLGTQLSEQNIEAEQQEIDRLNASREDEIAQITDQGGADEATINYINKRYDDLISKSQEKIDESQKVLSGSSFSIKKEVESLADLDKEKDKDEDEKDKDVLSRLEMASPEDENYSELQRFSKNKGRMLSLVDSDFAGMEEEEVALMLNKRMGSLDADFQYLYFQESGATGDYLTIANKFTGDEMEFFLDNVTSEMDKDQSSKIRSYIDLQMEFPEYTYLTDKIRKMEYAAMANPELFGIVENQYGGISKRKEDAWENIKSGAKYRSNPAMYNRMYEMDKQNLIALSKNPEYIEAKRQLSAIIAEMSSYALKDDNTAFAFSRMKANDASMSLMFDKVELERAKYNQQVQQQRYDQEMALIMSSLDSYRDVGTGQIDFSKVPEEEKRMVFDAISTLEEALNTSNEAVTEYTDNINTKQENINKVASSAAIASEDFGTPLSDIKHAAFRGLVTLPSFINRVESTFNPDVEVITKDEMARFIGGQGVTQEYSASEDRAFAQKVLTSLTESISTAVSTAGLMNSQTAFTLSSTVDALEVMDDPAFDDISAAEKWIYSGIYGVGMGALENLGFSKSLAKTPAGKATIRALFHKTLKDLPKDATLETLETELKRNARATILKGGIDMVSASVAEGGTEYVQEGLDATMKLLYNKIRNEDLFETYDSFADFNNSAWEQALLGAAGGGMMQGTTKILSGKASTWDIDSVKLLDQVLNRDSSRGYKEFLDTQVSNGNMTQEEADKRAKSADQAQEIFESIPDTVKGDNRYDAFSLIAEKKELENRIKGKDRSLVSKESERITEINQQLKAISDEDFRAKLIEGLEKDLEFERSLEDGGNPENISTIESQISTLKEIGSKAQASEKAESADKEISVTYKEGADVEYKIDGGFYKESDFIERMNEDGFMAKVKSGEVKVEVQNPSSEVEALLTPKPVQDEVQQTQEAKDQAQEVVTFNKDPESTPTLTNAINQTNGNLSRLSGKANQETRRRIIEEVTGEKVPLSKAGVNNMIDAVDSYLGVDTGKIRPRINDDINSWAKSKTKDMSPAPVQKTDQGAELKYVPFGPSMTPTAGMNSRQKKFVLNADPTTPEQAIAQTMLSGVRIDKEVASRELKLSDAEINKKKTLFSSSKAGGATIVDIDGMIETLRGKYREFFEQMDDSDIRSKILDVLTLRDSAEDLQHSLTEDFSVDGVIYQTREDRAGAEKFRHEQETQANIDQEAFDQEIARLEAEIAEMTPEQLTEAEQEFDNYIESLTDEEIEDQFGELTTKIETQQPVASEESVTTEAEQKGQKRARKVEETTPPTPKTPVAEGETKGPEKVSRMSKRAAKKSDDPEVKKLLNRIGKYNTKTNEGVTRYVEDLIKALGPEGAYEYASTEPSLNRMLKNAIIATAGLEIAMKAKSDLQKAQDSGNAEAEAEARERMIRGYDIINQSSLEKTISGQDIQYTRELYKKYPSMFQLALLQKFENSNSGELDTEYSEDADGNPVTAREAIEDLQEKLQGDVDTEVSAKMDEILSRLESTESENESLRREIEKMKADFEKKLGTKKQRVQKAKKKRSDAIEKLRKAGKSGQASASIIGLNEEQIGAILDIVSSFVEEGVANTDIILTRTLKIVRDVTKNKGITKDHIKNIADTIDEFNAARRVEQGQKKLKLVEKIFSKEIEISSNNIDKSIENSLELWEQYQNETLKGVKASLRKSSSSAKKKALLDKLNTSIKGHISQSVKDIRRKAKSGKKNTESVFDIISDLVSNQEKINRAYKAILDSNAFTASEKKVIQEVLDAHPESSFNLTSEESRKVIIQGQKLTGQKLKEIVRSHYKGRHGYARTLAQSIMANTELDSDTANAIASSLESELKSTIDGMVEKRLTEMLMNERTTMAELKKKKMDGTISDSEMVELTNRLKSSQNQKIEKKIIDAVNMGALSRGKDFQSAFERKFGFKNIPSSVRAKLISITDRIADLEMKAVKEITDAEGNVVDTIDARYVEQVARLQREFNTLLESQLPVNTAIVLREIVSAQYIGMLSNPKTFGRAFIGGYSSGFLGLLAFNMRNVTNIKALGAGYKAAIKSLPAAWSRARTARKTGYDFFQDNALKGEYSSSRKSRTEAYLFEGLGDGINSLYDKEATTPYLKRLFHTSLKSVAQTLKVIHAIGALDAFMNTIGGSMVGATNEYKEHAKANRKNPTMNMTATELLRKKKVREAAYDSIADEEYNDLVADITKQVRSEAKASGRNVSESTINSRVQKRLRDELGIRGSVTASPRRTYKTRRIQELRENAMGRYFEVGIELSKDASLMGKPDGIVGMGIEKFQGALNIKAEDNAFVASSKFILNSLFKFVRMTGVVINKSVNNIPVLGIANAFIGPGWDPVNKEWNTNVLGKWRANPELARQRVALNSLISTIFFAVMTEMFEFGDDDDDSLDRLGNLLSINVKKWKLDPNRRIDIRGFGFAGMGGPAKNRRFNEDWENISFSITKDKDGNFTNYMNTRLSTELAAVSASVGVFSDDFKGDASDDDVYERMDSPFLSYSKRMISNNMRLFTESSFSSVGRMSKNFMMEEEFVDAFYSSARGVFVDNTRSVVNPGSAQFITSFFTSQMQLNAPDYQDNLIADIFRGGYGLDHLVSKRDRTDLFGNPYPETNDVNEFVYGLTQKRSEQFDKTVGLLYKFDKGLDIGKWNASTFKKAKTFKYNKKEYRVTSDEIRNEVIELQETMFREKVLDRYDYLNSIEDREVLNKRMKKYQTQSKNKAKRIIWKKYYSEGKNNGIILVDK